MAVVYIHRKLESKEVFYVGISKKDDLKRPFSKHSRNPFWRKVVEKYDYEVELFKCNIPHACATTWEKILICKYGRRDLDTGTLVNLTDGGEVPLNLSEESRKKMSANKGKKVPMEMILKRAKRKSSVRNIESMSKRVNVGKYMKRGVIKLDIHNNFVSEYSSLAEAYRATGIRQGNIYSVCIGNRSVAGGYKWKYKKYEGT